MHMKMGILSNRSPVYTIVIASCLVLLTSVQGFAQEKILVTGQVKSIDNAEALPGANVLELGTTNGTVTDSDGKYSLSVSPNAKLVFSFIGYVNEEVEINGRSVIDV